MDLFKTQALTFANFLGYPDICIPCGRVNFLVGESGSGKSSLLKLFNATVSPSSGDIHYKGRNIEAIDTLELRRNILLVSQDVYLFPGTVQENISQFYGHLRKAEPCTKTFKSLMSLCCLDLPLDYDTLQMSGGERQRLYLALMLSFQPDTILLDEPTSALDNTTAFTVFENMLTFFREKETNVVVISHSSEVTERFAENIISLEGRSQ